MTAAAARPAIEVRAAASEDAAALAEFFRQTWDPKATAASVLGAREAAARENLADPGAPVPTSVVLADGRVVGYCSSIPIRLWDGRADLPAHWVKGLMVLPEYRNGPIGFHVLKDLVTRLPRSLVVTAAAASVRLFGALGYRHVGVATNYLLPLRPGRLAARLDLAGAAARIPGPVLSIARAAQRTGALELLGGAAGVAAQLAGATARLPAWGLVTTSSAHPPDATDLDYLWAAMVRQGTIGVVRNARYIGLRYRSDRYRFVTVRDGRALRALAVVRGPREQNDPRVRGLSVGALADLVAPAGDARAAMAAVGGAAALARDLDGDALLATSSSPWLRRILLSQAWVPAGGNMTFLVRGVDPAGGPPTALADWWLTRGDGHSDEAL